MLRPFTFISVFVVVPGRIDYTRRGRIAPVTTRHASRLPFLAHLLLPGKKIGKVASVRGVVVFLKRHIHPVYLPALILQGRLQIFDVTAKELADLLVIHLHDQFHPVVTNDNVHIDTSQGFRIEGDPHPAAILEAGGHAFPDLIHYGLGRKVFPG